MPIDLLLNVGSILTSVAWDVTAAHYLFTREPYQSLREGRGLSHPGFGAVGGVGLGPALLSAGRRVENLTGVHVPSPLRSGIKTALAGGMVRGPLAFDPKFVSPQYSTMAGNMAGSAKPRAQKIGRTMNRNIRTAKFIRGAGTVAGALAIANLVGGVIMPIAYSAGQASATVGKAAQVAMSQIAANPVDWSNQASVLMLAHASTERQRSLQVLQQTGMTGNSAMGREAQLYHR
jgi:hypothetical protein